MRASAQPADSVSAHRISHARGPPAGPGGGATIRLAKPFANRDLVHAVQRALGESNVRTPRLRGIDGALPPSCWTDRGITKEPRALKGRGPD
jgi:hypothetical protein